MPLTLDNPQIRGFLRELAESPGDSATVRALVDWLQEQDATIADMAVLYAGAPPHHEDGIPHAAIGLWLQCRGGPHAEDGADVARCKVVALGSAAHYRVYRYEPDGSRVFHCFGGGAGHAALRRDVAEAGREVRRQVLSLPWAEGVLVRREALLPRAELARAGNETDAVWGQWAAFVRAGIRRDVPYHSAWLPGEDACRYWQDLTAPQLVWPEPPPLTPAAVDFDS